MTHSVLEKKVLIGGQWVESESGERFEVKSPGDGSIVGTVPKCTRKDTQNAIAAAREGQKAMAKLSVLKRIELLHRATEIAKARDEEFCRIMCMESGKVLQQSISEASPVNGYSWSNFHVATANIKTYRGLTFPNVTEDSTTKRIMSTYEPVGVVANLSTFSYPSEMPNCSIPYGLALGNAVIVKPSCGAPLSAIFLAEVLVEAGFPPGSISVVTGPGAEVGDELVTNPGTHAINFFGQEATAERITQRASLKKLAMAIVSNNPFIVMADGNIEEAVNSAISGCYGHNGQSPITTRRILVHKDVHRKFTDLLVEKTKALNFTNPMDEKADIGPVNNAVILKTALERIEDARSKGGKILMGGNNPEGLYLEPTIIDDANQDMLVTNEATMGPVVPIMTFGNIDEAVEMANGTRFGFQAGAFTNDLADAYHLAENVKVGSFYVNEATTCYDEMAPFGGVKRSGSGRILSDWIFNELSQTKMILIDLGKAK